MVPLSHSSGCVLALGLGSGEGQCRRVGKEVEKAPILLGFVFVEKTSTPSSTGRH